jgi:hypothetical protein
MRRWILSAAAGFVFCCISSTASTQTVTADTLALARQLVEKIDPNPQHTVSAMSGPLVGMIQQMGIRQPDRAQALVQEALLPILNEHIADLSDLSVQAYAQVLTADDLKAILAFYNSKAGANLSLCNQNLRNCGSRT